MWARVRLKTSQILLAHQAVIFIMVISSLIGYVTSQLDGSIPRCTEEQEGEDVYVPGISDDPCISCYCREEQITCMKQQCASIEGCHMLLFGYEEISCCETCRGCYFEGRSYDSGSEWTDPSNPCRSYKCQAGVVTISDTECQASCSDPQYIPGQCCPVCRGCFVGGVVYLDGQSFNSPTDVCSTCLCDNGSVSCRKNACPVLNCIDTYTNYTIPGACCPSCWGTRQIFDLQKRACLFKNKVVANDHIRHPDPCTDCMCVQGTMVCKREVCPPITCPSNYYVINDNSTCCPRCERPPRSCKVKFEKHEDGTTWNPDDCTTCSCNDGVVRCQVYQCSNAFLQCPQNTHLQYVSGKCCPECVDDYAVCTVFGDPHYRTFDGAIYNFQGLCNYILARDCSREEEFSIHVRNDARLTNDFAWTKSVTIRTGRVKVYLFRNFRVKLNRKRVGLPYDGFGIKISASPFTLTLKTSEGVKVIWDGDSYLEVSVPPKYKDRMCGLCGNYNNNEFDDLTGRDKQQYFHADDFGETWRIGQKTLCLQEAGSHGGRKVACGTKEEKRKARKACSVLRGGGVLSMCARVVQAQPYYESCVADVCDCPESKDCSCEAVRAYVSECQRHNINIEWSEQLCQAEVCEPNSIWNTCADPCPSTCANMHRKFRRTCSKICEPGCECQPGFVKHDGECLEPEACPESTRKRNRNRNKESLDSLDIFLEYTSHSSDKDHKRSKRRRTKTDLEQDEQSEVRQSVSSLETQVISDSGNKRSSKSTRKRKKSHKTAPQSDQVVTSEHQMSLLQTAETKRESEDMRNERLPYNSDMYQMPSDNVRTSDTKSVVLFQGRDMFNMLDHEEN